MKYKLERKERGVWYFWGIYEDPVKLAQAAFGLGRMGKDQIRITPIFREGTE